MLNVWGNFPSFFKTKLNRFSIILFSLLIIFSTLVSAESGEPGEGLNIMIFVLMLFISILFLYIGYMKKEEFPYMQIVGYVFIFIISMTFLSSGIYFKSGESSSMEEIRIDENTLETQETMSHTYTNYKNFKIAFYMTLVSVVGFISVLFSLKPVVE